MIWNRRSAPYKNAITNELFITASVGMYLHFPGDNNTSPFALGGVRQTGLEPVVSHDDKYLKAAIDGYDWLKNSNMTNAQGLYVDGYHIRHWRRNGTKCNERNEMVYTYNQGVLLSGLRGLWEGTGNRTYLDDGHELARNTIIATGWSLDDQKNVTCPGKWAGMGRDGILEDRCDALGSCSQDSQTFKGIFFHHLSLLCEPLPLKARVPGTTHKVDRALASLHGDRCQSYALWIAHNGKAALKTRDRDGKFGTWWGARYDADVQPLTDGAIDYRNNVSELLGPLWYPEAETWAFAVSQMPMPDFAEPHGDVQALASIPEVINAEFDWNDRGRGRTVETQGGGVSVLSALWKIVNMT